MNALVKEPYAVNPQNCEVWIKLLHEAHEAEKEKYRDLMYSMKIWTFLAVLIWLTGWNDRGVLWMAIILCIIWCVCSWWCLKLRRRTKLCAALEELQPPHMRGRGVEVYEVDVPGIPSLFPGEKPYVLMPSHLPYEYNKGISIIEKSAPPLR